MSSIPILMLEQYLAIIVMPAESRTNKNVPILPPLPYNLLDKNLNASFKNFQWFLKKIMHLAF